MIAKKIIKALKKVTNTEDVKLDIPSEKNHGDYATNLALCIGDCQKRPPREIAEEIKDKILKNFELKKIVDKIEIAGPGFINFFLTNSALVDFVNRINSVDSLTPYLENEKMGKVVVEYSSPNIAKPFGIGHFRSTVIGDAVANLLEATGWKVYRDNHLGDWGTQFGKQIYAIKKWGDIAKIEKSKNPVGELVSLYVRFHEEAEKDSSLEEQGREWFKRLEDGDVEARALWQKCVNWSLKEFGRVYKKLGVKFTENDGLGYGESYFEHMMQPVLVELEKKRLLVEGEEGAKLVFFENNKYPPLMLVKKDGATLYATRDLAADKFRLEKYGKDTVIINEVGAEQSLYFQQLFEVEKMLGWIKEGQRVHIKHGLFRLKDRKMSTRRGDIIWLMDVIREAESKAEQLIKISSRGKMGFLNQSTEFDLKKLIEQVAIGALKWNELKRDPVKDIVFDWKEVLSMEGNSGPYLQYTYARTASILSKSVPEKETISTTFDDKEKQVARVLIHYPEIVKDAARFYSPHILANYLFNLAREFNYFYSSDRVIGHEREITRLLLVKAVGRIIRNGLDILGIESPEKM